MKTIAVPCAKLAHDAEEVAHFLGREGRRGFVHEQHARLLREGGGKFDHLLIGDGEASNFAARVELDAELRQERVRLCVHRAPIDEPGGRGALLTPGVRYSEGPDLGLARIRPFASTLRGGLCGGFHWRGAAAHEDIFGDIQIGETERLLVNQCDSELERSQWGGDIQRLAIEPQFAGVGSMDAGEDFHQRAFSSAVFAHQGVHLAGAQVEIHGFQNGYTRERFADVVASEDGF